MKITKKLLAVLLSALVLLGAMPVAVVSAEEFTADNGLKYTVDNEAVTITGYDGEAAVVVIPAEISGVAVKIIGGEAFKNNKALAGISIPEGIETIEGRAFENCTALTAVDVPDTVTEIKYDAFAGCTALESVELSKSLAFLGEGAFAGTAVKEIFIPKSLVDADDGVFNTSYEADGVEYSVVNGPFAACQSLKTVTFEKGTTVVADFLFAGCPGIEEITLPDTVTEIKEAAFKDCLNLSKVTMGDNVTKIGNESFYNACSLEGIELSKGLTSIGTGAFSYTSLKSVEIPRKLNNGGVHTFSTNYKFNGEEYDVERGPFSFCEDLKTVTFERGTTKIAKELFAGCVSLEKITIPDTVITIEEKAFIDCVRLAKVDIPDTVTVIGSRAFESCVSLKSVELSNSLKDLGNRAFAYSALESIEIPASLEKAHEEVFADDYTFDGKDYSLERGPFNRCDNLKTVTFEEGSKYIPECVLAGVNFVEKIVIPEGVESINYHAFQGCVRLSDITFPSTLKTIGEGAFASCASIKSMTVPETVELVEKSAFNTCTSLESVEFKNADAVLKKAVLGGCTALTDVKLPANLKELPDSVFYGCTSLKSVNLPETIQTIGAEAFYGCASLDEAVIPENVKTIGNGAFKNCTNLKSINIPKSVRTLGYNAFLACENLTDVDFADYTVKEIKEGTFKDCFSLKAIELPKGIVTIGEEAFMNCVELFDVTIPESAEEIADNAFSYPSKTTLYSQTGSFVEQFANDNGFKFVDGVKDIESISLKGGVTKLVLEEKEVYPLEFVINPEDGDEVIKLTSSNDGIVDIDGINLVTSFWNDTVEIKAETLSGAEFTFEVYVRGIDFIRVVDGTYQQQYATGDEFNPEGIRVEAHYSDDTVVELQGFTFEGFDSSKPGDCKVVVKWTDDKGEEYDCYFNVEITGEEPPKFQSQKDETTQVVVEAVTKATLSVVEVTDKIKFDEVNLKLSGEKVSKFFDITLVEDGEAVQPDGTVTVKIPCDDETAKVYRFEDDGTLTDMKAEFVDGFMVFTTEHFSFYVVTEAESEFDLGDANKDGKLNIRDATIIQKYLAKLADLDEEAVALSDFDGNGKVNVKDATAIQKKLAGIR
ncbi:MAG: leucine-rich repeat protein [Clostridia bacterium]|nr:leucine-rich repeat protein [Clostridia bacterium]